MIDAPPIGKILGPNLTTGQGSVVGAYAVADWDRIVRHGVKPDGTPAVMPSEDYFAMSDRELSDIIAYIRSMPPVDAVVPPPTFGPVGTLLLATGELRLSAEQLGDHQAAHAAEPPVEGPTAAFGAHLAAVCTGCHGAALAGGKIPGGDPAWAPAANLTPHADGLAGWTYEDFERARTEGKRRDGRELLAPMTQITPYGRNMTVVDRQALWAYLTTVPAQADPKG
jgi:mono/diheme cytochrome c family protein